MLRTPVHAHFSKSNAQHTNIHINVLHVRMTISADMVISKKQQKKKKIKQSRDSQWMLLMVLQHSQSS